MILLLCCIAILLHLLGMPWWCMLMVIAAVSFAKPVASGKSFVRGFLSMSIPWIVLCIWSSWLNDHILAARVAELFGLPHWSLLVLCTGLLGGILGGMTMLCAYFTLKLFATSSKNPLYLKNEPGGSLGARPVIM